MHVYPAGAAVHTLQLDNDIQNELTEMQQKGIDVNELLRQFLQKRKTEIEEKKSEISKMQTQEREERAVIGMPAKRYIPATVRHILKAEFGTLCSAKGCTHKAENLHHEQGFAKTQHHDPKFIKPLCRAHHELAHLRTGNAPLR